MKQSSLILDSRPGSKSSHKARILIVHTSAPPLSWPMKLSGECAAMMHRAATDCLFEKESSTIPLTTCIEGLLLALQREG